MKRISLTAKSCLVERDTKTFKAYRPISKSFSLQIWSQFVFVFICVSITIIMPKVQRCGNNYKNTQSSKTTLRWFLLIENQKWKSRFFWNYGYFTCFSSRLLLLSTRKWLFAWLYIPNSLVSIYLDTYFLHAWL